MKCPRSPRELVHKLVNQINKNDHRMRNQVWQVVLPLNSVWQSTIRVIYRGCTIKHSTELVENTPLLMHVVGSSPFNYYLHVQKLCIDTKLEDCSVFHLMLKALKAARILQISPPLTSSTKSMVPSQASMAFNIILGALTLIMDKWLC